MKRKGNPFGVTLTIHGLPSSIELERSAGSTDEIPEVNTDALDGTFPKLRLVASRDLGLDGVTLADVSTLVDEPPDPQRLRVVELDVELREPVSRKPLRPRP